MSGRTLSTYERQGRRLEYAGLGLLALAAAIFIATLEYAPAVVGNAAVLDVSVRDILAFGLAAAPAVVGAVFLNEGISRRGSTRYV